MAPPKPVSSSRVALFECRTQCLRLSRLLTTSARTRGMPDNEAFPARPYIPVSNQASHQQQSFVIPLTRRHVINGEAFDVKKSSSKPRSSESSGPRFLPLFLSSDVSFKCIKIPMILAVHTSGCLLTSCSHIQPTLTVQAAVAWRGRLMSPSKSSQRWVSLTTIRTTYACHLSHIA